MSNSSLSKRRGKYGRSKFRAFLVLSQLSIKYGREGWLGTRELAVLSGLPYRSLTRLLPKWVRYEYVERQACSVKGRGEFEYKLLPHGSAWVRVASKRLYNRHKFHDELKLWLNEVALPHYKLLLSMPFNAMVTYLNILLTMPAKVLKDAVLTFRVDMPIMPD
ncbi:MAG: hypothetical protein HY529_03180 [Chloroflexi bacterium]|nr:hypothetical protein [Chloroflexota bacterium]